MKNFPLRRAGYLKRREKQAQSTSYQSLEPRQLLASLTVDSTASITADQAAPEIQQTASYGEQALSLPAGLQNSFTTSVVFGGERLTLELNKNSVFNENTRFLVDDGSGQLVEVGQVEDSSYLGTVVEQPGYRVSAVLTDQGLLANIIRPNQRSIEVTPTGGGLHSVALAELAVAHDHDGDGVPDHSAADHSVVENSSDNGDDDCSPGCQCPACVGSAETAQSTGPIDTLPLAAVGTNVPAASTSGSTATLPPTRVLDVREYEVGVEIGSAAFLNNYSGNLALAQSVAQGIAGNLDARFLHATGIKYRIGTVIIRTSAAADKFTVSNGNDGPGLDAFRDYWNSNPGEVGNTHDLAVYHVRASPSGLAYVNAVGTSNRYALSASNGATSWADGTLAHEFGHSWNLQHVNDGLSSGLFYESKPRNNNGSSSAGGTDTFVSIMDGRGQHNIGRLASDEAIRVLNARQNKLGFGDVISSPGGIRPFGHRDSVSIGNSDPITIDVIANDYDVNNDVLDVRLLDTVSQQGATISLSVGTGPGGRNQIVYTPGPGTDGTDFFHYTVFDSTGRTDWGAVYVENTSITIDPNDTEFYYDLGTDTSPVGVNDGKDWEKLTPSAGGDVTWSVPVSAVDRNPGGGVNAVNRDLVFNTQATTLNHKLGSGIYQIVLNMSDPSISLDNMIVRAEGITQVSDIDRPIGQNGTFSFEVAVTDGELNLEFDDADTNKRWAVTRLFIVRVGEAAAVVDTSQTTFRYDVGAANSTLFNDANNPYTILSDTVTGDISWSSPVTAFDNGTSGGTNAINRDGVFKLNGSSTLEHKVANGVWSVLVTFGTNVPLDQVGITAEGEFQGSQNYAANAHGNYEFEVTVNDGGLSLTFQDEGGIALVWSVTRIVLNRTGDNLYVVDTAQDSYDYDLGPDDSPVADGFVGIGPGVVGDISWTGVVTANDRGPSGTSDLTRDFVTGQSSGEFKHLVDNGIWHVRVDVGDADEAQDNLIIGAETGLIATGVSTVAGEFLTFEFDVEVTDGQLNLGFVDTGGANLGWAVNRISLDRVVDTESNPLIVDTLRDAGDIARPDLWQTITYTFDNDVNVTADALTLYDDTNQQAVDISAAQFNYDSGSKTATWSFDTLAAVLPAAYYSTTLDGSLVGNVSDGSLLDGAGSGTAGSDHLQQYYVAIPGDASLDGQVDVFTDGFAFLANIGLTSGATWAQGDFDGNGNVDVFGDGFALLANIGSSVIPASASPQSIHLATPNVSAISSESAATPVVTAAPTVSLVIDDSDQSDSLTAESTSTSEWNVVSETSSLVLAGSVEVVTKDSDDTRQNIPLPTLESELDNFFAEEFV